MLITNGCDALFPVRSDASLLLSGTSGLTVVVFDVASFDVSSPVCLQAAKLKTKAKHSNSTKSRFAFFTKKPS
ncbi:MAG TPA: hypothetical protein PLD48_04440 [Bacillota bacterium]|nr:hypothetical protein [Bacillota bacterium]